MKVGEMVKKLVFLPEIPVMTSRVALLLVLKLLTRWSR